MKKVICFFFLIYGIFTYAGNKTGAIHSNKYSPGDSVQVFLGISNNDEVLVSTVRSALSSIQGVSVLAYCNNHAVFMLYLNTSTARDDRNILAQLKNALPKQANLFSIKQGGTFSDFYSSCQASDITEAQNIKNSINSH
ncbi:MAG TPA: hypothetical protein VN026_05210 [Bacteroidia bacterium]|jgi:hypothetical protein|nr:hypothetical protein [Bacteroidia bacterium]